ncbi:31548_t:CDS:2, partial [Gigaspora margarita]
FKVQETLQISNALKIASPKFSQVKKALEIWITNADGTKKLALLVINIFKMPNAFHNANITSYNQLPINYYYNESIWMCQDIFQ